MNEEMLLQNLIDFFEGEGEFKIRNDYLGMEASSIPNIFIDYFNKLESSKKDKTAEIIVAGIIGREKKLVLYLSSITHLVLSLCLNDYTHHFKNHISELEQEFNNPISIDEWIANGDITPIEEGLLYKKDWHYALELWGILYLIGSNKINDTYNKLIDNAKNDRLSESLRLAKQTYDELI